MHDKYLTALSRHTALQYAVFLVISIVYLFVASPYTSPSNPYYNCDSGIFYTIGNGINNGLLPYRDLFDHKGPLLFYIYALGTFIIKGKGGVFLLQALSLALSMTFIYKFCRLFLSGKLSICTLMLVLCILPACIGEGALSEEWSLPFSLIPLYFVTRELIVKGEVQGFSKRYCFLLGVCFGIHATIRLNNSAIVCGIVTFIFLMLLCKLRVREIISSAAQFILGCAAIFIPVCLFFHAQGAIADFWQGSYIHNIEIALYGANTKSDTFWLEWISKTISAPIILGIGFFLIRQKILTLNLYLLFSIVAIVSMVSLIAGSGFPHYYTTNIPCVVIALALCFKLTTHKIAGCVSISMMLIPYIEGTYNLVLCGLICLFFPGHPSEKQFQLDSAAEFRKIVTEEHLNEVLILDAFADMYLYMGATPAFKYFTLQSTHAQISPEIKDELNQLFAGKDSPKFVILRQYPEGKNKEISELAYMEVKNALAARYKRVASGKTKRSDQIAFSLYQKQDK